MPFIDEEFNELRDNFLGVTKRVLKRKISKNPDTLSGYVVQLREAYNELLTYVRQHYNECDAALKSQITKHVSFCRDKLLRAFGKLNRKTEVKENLFSLIGEVVEISDTGSNTESESEQDKDSGKTDYFENKGTTSNSNMTEISQTEFLRLAAQTIPKNFSGDPLGLMAFINSINLLKTLCGNHTALLLQFVQTRLEGKALEAIPPEPASLDAIISALKGAIKHENSKIIAGRMMALKADRSSFKDFAKQAEELADALKRSLIVEGISQSKAQEMSIEKTVEMCRASARSDLVKSILTSTAFADPREVVAKFTIEAATDTKEKQVLAFHNSRGRGRGNRYQTGRYQNRGNSYRGNHNKSYRGNYHNNNSYGRNEGHYANNRGNRGNRGHRGNRGNFGNRGNNTHDIRVTENSRAPSSGRRGSQESESD